MERDSPKKSGWPGGFRKFKSAKIQKKYLAQVNNEDSQSESEEGKEETKQRTKTRRVRKRVSLSSHTSIAEI